ncbi:hypothetical protein DCS_05690 [Drechmeria coniospora]|uniref:Uncharacterized protein n=1 Tax=Drechmeria coniospora TaxID=98403 RepID=A0A151GNI8_DRECN|nr:hypothetical protein DCS_05690 [Drechmeria coniospora]KYK58673.1 hypothetical protein DCS_05690 [Drechmeria coniospora]
MGDPFDIQNLLQTGYFTTSRAKTSPKPTGPPSLAPAAPKLDSDATPIFRRSLGVGRSYPPSPSVEDEPESLAREFGTFAAASPSDETIPSRGDIEQQPLIMEAHEHNSERRFVLLNEPQTTRSVSESKTMGPNDAEASAPEKEKVASLKPDAYLKHESSSSKGEARAGSAKPDVGRRRSRPDLPHLETELRPTEQRGHYRSRSSASASQPDFRFQRESRSFGDQLLSPDIVQTGLGGREKSYRGHGPSSASDARSSTGPGRMEIHGGRRDDGYRSRRRTYSSSRRSESSFEPVQYSRRPSNEFEGSRRRQGSSTSRTDRRDMSQSHDRGGGDGPKASSRPPRESSQLEDEYSNDSRPSYQPKKPVVVVQAGRSAAISSTDKGMNSSGKSRSRSRIRIMTSPETSEREPASASTFAPEIFAPFTPRTSATFPGPSGAGNGPSGRKAPLPYPDDDDDDDLAFAGLGISGGDGAADQPTSCSFPTMSMPELPPVTLGSRMDTKKASSPAAATPTEGSRSWQPASFDPERDGIRSDRKTDMGTYRRFSESTDKDSVLGLPNCPRTTPVAGTADWLTLPRTKFNICPTCYKAVFAATECRTQFQPTLHPNSEAVVCDFGSSPWYRIAWLLTLKHERPHLRLLYQIATLMNSPRMDVCAGSQKLTRPWLTVKDPYTRQPVPKFAVCYQCAAIVEALLPNLESVFVPLMPRSEPTRDTCALHFTPKRRMFVLLFDALETTSDRAFLDGKAPNLGQLAQELQRLTIGGKCREDSPVHEGYWHMMQFLPEFTVCGACFDNVVQPKLGDKSTLAHNFYMRPQQLKSATCQLYSPRMREIFSKACKWKDADFLREKVLERRSIEAEIYEKLVKLDRAQRNDAWTEEQVEKLVSEWRRWE